MTFVGEVNIFHGRVQNGRAVLGSLAIDYPAHASSEARKAVGYARPHELDLRRQAGGDGLPATVRDIRVSGALVKVELVDRDEAVIQVDLGREQYERLQLAVGERVSVKPRRMRVFTSD
jgi:sulfate transport system ATP-binding protein